MLMDSKGKLFGKISIVDVLVILVVLAAIGGVGYKYAKSNQGNPIISTKSDNIELVFYAEEVPDYVGKAIKDGDIVSDFDRKSTFGHVVGAPKIGKSVSWVETDKGENVPASKDGYSSIYLTVDGKGHYNDSSTKNGVTIEGVDYFIGRTVIIEAGHATYQCRIYDIKKKG